jgi:hypothetical protein
MASAKQSGKAGKAADKNSNRRKFDRRDTDIVAQLNHDGHLVNGVVTNLSLEGCLFAPRLDIPVGARVKLKLAGEHKAVPATVKGVSDLGVHCLLHAGGATLGRLSVEVDDMALLMLNASRPHVVEPVMPAAQKKPAAKKQAAPKKPATKKKIVKKKATKKAVVAKTKAPVKKTAAKKPPAKKPVVKKAAKKKAAKRR